MASGFSEPLGKSEAYGNFKRNVWEELVITFSERAASFFWLLSVLLSDLESG